MSGTHTEIGSHPPNLTILPQGRHCDCQSEHAQCVPYLPLSGEELPGVIEVRRGLYAIEDQEEASNVKNFGVCHTIHPCSIIPHSTWRNHVNFMNELWTGNIFCFWRFTPPVPIGEKSTGLEISFFFFLASFFYLFSFLLLTSFFLHPRAIVIS